MLQKILNLLLSSHQEQHITTDFCASVIPSYTYSFLLITQQITMQRYTWVQLCKTSVQARVLAQKPPVIDRSEFKRMTGKWFYPLGFDELTKNWFHLRQQARHNAITHRCVPQIQNPVRGYRSRVVLGYIYAHFHFWQHHCKPENASQNLVGHVEAIYYGALDLLWSTIIGPLRLHFYFILFCIGLKGL